MTLNSRYMRMEEEARTAIKVRARERYYRNIEEQRMKRYLNALRKGLVRCPQESTLARHGILSHGGRGLGPAFGQPVSIFFSPPSNLE